MFRLRPPDRLQIATDRLLIRLARRGDEALLAGFYTQNRAFLQPFSPTFSEELFSARAWRERIESTIAEYRSGKGIRFVFFAKHDPAHVVGVANFTSITGFPSFMCNLGYSMGECDQGKGLMTEGLSAAIEYAFTERAIHRIEANYMPRNQRSANVLERLGFVIEGRSDRYILINGVWEEHVRTALTNSSWMQTKP